MLVVHSNDRYSSALNYANEQDNTALKGIISDDDEVF